MEILIALFIVFAIAFVLGMAYGAYFFVKMYNSDKQKDRDWAINLLNRKKHGII